MVPQPTVPLHLGHLAGRVTTQLELSFDIDVASPTLLRAK